MNVGRQRVLNVFGGVMAFVVGLGFGAAALYVVHMPPVAAKVTNDVPAHLASCENSLRALGFNTRRFPTELRAEQPTLDHPQQLLSQASLGISLCHLPLLRFCMGSGCRAPAIANGISFALATQSSSSPPHR